MYADKSPVITVFQYVYLKSEPELFTVGFYDPTGKWQPESDHHTAAEAAARVAWLNGTSKDITCPTN